MNKHETLNMNHETQGNLLLSPHFRLSEFEASRTAAEQGIANVAPPEAVENLRRLCEGCLEPLREALGRPIVITSGYRCQRLNEILVHAARKSQHMQGCAADFYVGQAQVSGFRFQVSGDLKLETGDSPVKLETPRQRLIEAFKTILQDSSIDYDQVILYPNFIHVSYVSKERNRHGILKALSNGKLGYGRLTLENALKVV